MGCCLPDDGWKACERCPAIELFCKSAWIALLQNCTTSIAGRAHGRAHAKGFCALERLGFECDWQRLSQPIPKLASSVNFSMRKELPLKTESSAASRYVALQEKGSRLVGPI